MCASGDRRRKQRGDPGAEQAVGRVSTWGITCLPGSSPHLLGGGRGVRVSGQQPLSPALGSTIKSLCHPACIALGLRSRGWDKLPSARPHPHPVTGNNRGGEQKGSEALTCLFSPFSTQITFSCLHCLEAFFSFSWIWPASSLPLAEDSFFPPSFLLQSPSLPTPALQPVSI